MQRGKERERDYSIFIRISFAFIILSRVPYIIYENKDNAQKSAKTESSGFV